MDTTAELLRRRGFRATPQRLAILRILTAAGCHLTPLEVFQRARQAVPGMTEATVYRTLTFLTEQGMLMAAHVGSGQLVYEITGNAHHHLICRLCGETHQIDHSLLEDLYNRFQEHTGYQIDSMHVTFFGLCPHCQKASM